MIAEGLLWFDDDTHRPLLLKIADAIERYGERTGWRATVCEANATQAEAALAEIARAENPARRRSPAKAGPTLSLPARLRIRPNPSLRPNYFLVGVEAGERPHKAASAQPGGGSRRATSAKTTTAPAIPVANARRAKAPHTKAS